MVKALWHLLYWTCAIRGARGATHSAESGKGEEEGERLESEEGEKGGRRDDLEVSCLSFFESLGCGDADMADLGVLGGSAAMGKGKGSLIKELNVLSDLAELLAHLDERLRAAASLRSLCFQVSTTQAAQLSFRAATRRERTEEALPWEARQMSGAIGMD